MSNVSKYYKPEILNCAKCGTKLTYRHAVSNKLIYFTNGKRIQIHNLGYSCPKCNDNVVYFSQTANKFSVKGYTYSTKIFCTIAKLKEKKKGREEICDYFYTKGIEISDRNVDKLYNKYLELLALDYQEKISTAYKVMLDSYGQIRLSIDLITVSGSYFIIFYDYFTSEMLAFMRFESLEDPELLRFLSSYLRPDLNITVIATIRKDAVFVPMLKKLCPKNTKFIAYNKF
ncbi:MAG: hypothetical protein K2N65_05890 [Anaeroplasmataceae bacterium]|nr:hypothetical protein [Anaeroplasmataceae bacterium]